MKGFIEEYGKLVVGVLMVSLLLVFVLSGDGFLSKLGGFKPESTVQQDNVSDKLIVYDGIKEPTLVVETEKLNAGVSYDLLSFVTEAKSNAESKKSDGTFVPVRDLIPNVTVAKITDPFGNEIVVPDKVDGKIMFTFPSYKMNVETDDYTIGYRVTYQVVDDYYSDYSVPTTKTYQFVVD